MQTYYILLALFVGHVICCWAILSIVNIILRFLNIHKYKHLIIHSQMTLILTTMRFVLFSAIAYNYENELYFLWMNDYISR